MQKPRYALPPRLLLRPATPGEAWHSQQSVEVIRPILLEEAPKCEHERRVTPRAFQALRDAGIFGLQAPKRFGGLEAPPSECLTIWEAIGRIDASIGWTAFMTHAGVRAAFIQTPGRGAYTQAVAI